MSTLMHKERSKALLDFLGWAHAEEYTGVDDDMLDACNDWISGLTDDEVTDLVLETFHEGL